MKKPIQLIALLLLALGGFSPLNAKNVYQLDGYMGVRGGESFHYRIELSDSIGNILSGYSYTYKTKDKAVKAYLTAEINRKAKSLHIQEQQIISNQGFESIATICLVNADLSWNEIEKNLSGSLITQTSDNGAICSSGSIVFIRQSQINQLFSPAAAPQPGSKSTAQQHAASFVTREDPNQKLHAYFNQKAQSEKDQMSITKESQPQVSPNTTAQPVVKKITEGLDGAYLWHSNQIIFEIWDGGEIDNDRVTVSYNDTQVLKNYQLSGQKKRVVLNIGTNPINNITITANNEGANPPNTANIRLFDGDKVYDILAYNKTGRKAVIRIRKQQ